MAQRVGRVHTLHCVVNTNCVYNNYPRSAATLGCEKESRVCQETHRKREGGSKILGQTSINETISMVSPLPPYIPFPLMYIYIYK